MRDALSSCVERKERQWHLSNNIVLASSFRNHRKSSKTEVAIVHAHGRAMVLEGETIRNGNCQHGT
jgi:hypothetical protein